ncbi:hypothetical protein HPB50_000036 [Hyalomma asiaticum]|uniref:Uncharacterized protein n=1 Tax=Hyalomma asiaticum TaxID=266040 RepID=A0ACB7RH26_HYAAI|nr:hypothetical protein HPB50_000036 [Hyalomma asiaticum]
MNHEQGDIGDTFETTAPKSPDDFVQKPSDADVFAAPAPTPGAPLPKKLPPLAPAKEIFDFRRDIVSWCQDEIARAQPWKLFGDYAKLSVPRSGNEIVDRFGSNLRSFRGNYFIIWVVILVLYVTADVQLVGTLGIVAAVCAALKLHEDVDNATLWGTNSVMLSKNQRLLTAAAVGLALLFTVDVWTPVTSSVVVTVAVVFVHASVHSGLGAPVNNMEGLPEGAKAS